MKEKLEVIVASLIHDINQLGIKSVDNSVLDGISEANLSDSSRKIIKIANYIANGLAEDSNQQGVQPLKSIFNILNGNSEDCYVDVGTLSADSSIVIPSVAKPQLTNQKLSNIETSIRNEVKNADLSFDGINTILDSLEKNASFISGGNQADGVQDISLYDHLKMTSAIATCLFDYVEAEQIACIDEKLVDMNSMILYSMDFSGIQDFIYTINSKGALKTLRARSFYLEILMESIIDSLLQKLEVSRANLIYSGGGHCYILLPNTKSVKDIVEDNQSILKKWLLENFDVALYIADGYSECSGKTLNNKPNGSYSEIFRNVSGSISKKKLSRYSASEIKSLNSKRFKSYTRECSICKSLGTLNSDNECSLCSSIKNFSKNILNDDIFLIVEDETSAELPLPEKRWLTTIDEKDVSGNLKYARMYSKNKDPKRMANASKLWIGSYSSGKTFEEMADSAKSNGRIDRIGVVRADIDNLGTAFVSGFENGTDNKFVSLIRTATLSRRLSAFFKLHINTILSNPEFVIDGRKIYKDRNATICYSGGDDLFIVGDWSDVVELTVDIREIFQKYTQGTLSISAGIGIYTSSYPISRIAYETAELEDMSKGIPGKDGISFLVDGKSHCEITPDGDDIQISDGTYKWREFIDVVVGEKYKVLTEYFDNSSERGKNFLYNMLELIRNQQEKINLARFYYLVSRLEPSPGSDVEEKNRYKKFSSRMYEWIRSEKDCRQLKTAINLYAYMTRNEEK